MEEGERKAAINSTPSTECEGEKPADSAGKVRQGLKWGTSLLEEHEGRLRMLLWQALGSFPAWITWGTGAVSAGTCNRPSSTVCWVFDLGQVSAPAEPPETSSLKQG